MFTITLISIIMCILLSGSYGLQYQGCYKDKVSDPDLNVHLETSTSLTPSLCAERCKAAGQNYAISGVQFNANVSIAHSNYLCTYSIKTPIPSISNLHTNYLYTKMYVLICRYLVIDTE